MALVSRPGPPFFLDTSVLLAGLIEGLGPGSAPAGQLLGRLDGTGRRRRGVTAWHCCLEFYAVSTRLPEEFRLSPSAARELLREGILRRMEVHDLDPARREPFLDQCALSDVRGGRLYDAHIGEIALRSGAGVVVTDNVRHFGTVAGAGVLVLDAAGALQRLGQR